MGRLVFFYLYSEAFLAWGRHDRCSEHGVDGVPAWSEREGKNRPALALLPIFLPK
jgi:hypothetical protein